MSHEQFTDEKLIANEQSDTENFTSEKDNGTSTSKEEENFIPTTARSCFSRYCGPIGEGSLRGSTIAMASITFGGGCLSFPNAIAQTGPIVGLIIFALVAFFSYYTLYILTVAGIKENVYDYNNLLLKKTNRTMVFISDVNNILLSIGVIMSYQKTVYNFIFQLAFNWGIIDASGDNNTSRLIVMGVLMVVAQIPLSLLKNMSKLQYGSIVGTIALIYSILVIVIEMPFYVEQCEEINHSLIIKDGKAGCYDIFVKPHWGYLSTISTFLFGFSSHNGIFQVYDELKNRSVQRINKVLARSFIIELILYISISYGGYYSMGRYAADSFLSRPDMIGRSGKPINDVAIQIAKVTLIVCLHCTMAINYNIMRMSFKTMFNKGNSMSFVLDLIITIIVYIVCNISVFYIKSIVSILGVIGGICTVVICFVNPIVIHLRRNSKPLTHINNIFAMFSLGLLVLCGVAATAYSIVTMINGD